MNRTYIDDLPFLEDVMAVEPRNGGLNMIPSSESGKIKKFIRNNEYNIPVEAGMNTKQQQMMEEQELLQQQQIYEEQQRQLQQQENFVEEKRKSKKRHQKNYDECDLNCISVADHAANCIVCSKLYNNDKSLYLAIIGALILICAILMKKVVDK